MWEERVLFFRTPKILRIFLINISKVRIFHYRIGKKKKGLIDRVKSGYLGFD